MGRRKRYGDAKDLAERLGVSRPRITALLKSGIFNGAAKKQKDGTYRIDLDAAVIMAQQNIDPAQPRGKIKYGANGKSAGEDEEAGSGGMQARPAGGIDFATARSLNEQYKAAIRKLEYEEKIGKLIQADKVREAAFDMARQVRDAMQNIPDRIAAILAAESDEGKVRAVLDKEIREALEGLAKNDFGN